MELCKFIASFFVVFIHASFPGSLGSAVDCLARFAVPTFFMISGYFNYQATSSQIIRRIKHLVKLFILASLARLLWNCISIELHSGSTIAYLRTFIPESDELVSWIVLHKPPYTGHLWYLNAMIACYLVFLGFVRFGGEESTNYRPFYTLCSILFTYLFAFGIFAPISGTDSPLIVRNGWFLGLPMFGAGLFIRQYQEKIFTNFQLSGKKLVLLLLAGILLTFMQWKTFPIGMMAFGTLIEVLALMLLMVSHPKIFVRSKRAEKIVLKLGPLSMWIYLFHLTLIIAYEDVCQQTLQAVLGELEPYLYPLIIAAASLLTAIAFECFTGLLRKPRKGNA